MSIRVLLADDHKIVSNGLKSLIKQEPDMEVVGIAEDGEAALNMTLELEPDVVVMDIGMPVLNGVEATRRIVHERPQVKVVALSMHSDRRTVKEMLKAGAIGYLLKDCAFEELVLAIRSVVDNRPYLPSYLADLVSEDNTHRY